jgi:N-acetylglutamate synthase-like GNAT family acetyltransferase
MTYELIRVQDDADWASYHAIRRDVLWTARGLAGYDDKRPEERLPDRYSLLLKLDSQAIGTTRLDDRGDGTGIVRLVAVRGDLQRQGHGTKLAAMVDDFAVALGVHTLFVNAVADAVGYYEKLGWEFFDWDAAELALISGNGRQMRRFLASRSR